MANPSVLHRLKPIWREPPVGPQRDAARAALASYHRQLGLSWLLVLACATPVLTYGVVSAGGLPRPYALAWAIWALLGGWLGYRLFLRRLPPTVIGAWLIAGALAALLTAAFPAGLLDAFSANFSGASELTITAETVRDMHRKHAIAATYGVLVFFILCLAPLHARERWIATALFGLVAALVVMRTGVYGHWENVAVIAFFHLFPPIVGVLLDRRLAASGAVEAENAAKARAQAVRRYERELEVARQIHTSMRPPPSWAGPGGVEVRTYHMTHHEVGGDWLALRELPDGRILAIVVDVTGKGVRASLVAHAVQSLWAAASIETTFDPAAFLEDVNVALHGLSPERNQTATAGIVEIAGSQITYWSASHTPLKILWREGDAIGAKHLFGRGGFLGFSQTIHAKPVTFIAPPGAEVDVLLASDGVTDGMPRHPREAKPFLTRLGAFGTAAIEELPVDDDKTLVWIRFRMPESPA